MKKTLLSILLSALLAANISSCHYVPDNVVKSTNESAGSEINNGDSLNQITPNTDPSNGKDAPTTTKPTPPASIPTYSTQELVEELKLSSTFTSALKNETMIYDYNKDAELLQMFSMSLYPDPATEYAFVSAIDSDEDGTNDVMLLEIRDLVIVLREYEGRIYGWRCRGSAMYYLRVDGTYSWHSQASEGHMYGTRKFQFNGADRADIELDCIKNNEKFYINEIEVSGEEFDTYTKNKNLAEKAPRYKWKTNFETIFSDHIINGK